MGEQKNISKWSLDEFKQFVESYEVLFLTFAEKYTGNPASAEDIVQDCLCQLWLEKDRNRAIPIINAPAYVLMMIKNRSLNFLRKQRRISYNELEINIHYDKSFIDEVINRDCQHILEETIATLPEHWGKVIYLTMQGVSNKEIAKEMDCTVDSVKAIKKRAYKRLREVLPFELHLQTD